MTNTIFFTAAAAALALGAAPMANATEPTGTGNGTGTGTGTVDARTMSGTAKAETRYCVVETPTGSHIPQKECHTRSEWMRLGFDPLQK